MSTRPPRGKIAPEASRPSPATSEAPIAETVSSKLLTTGSFLRRGAVLRYRRLVGLPWVECGIVAVLGRVNPSRSIASRNSWEWTRRSSAALCRPSWIASWSCAAPIPGIAGKCSSAVASRPAKTRHDGKCRDGAQRHSACRTISIRDRAARWRSRPTCKARQRDAALRAAAGEQSRSSRILM